MLRSCALALVGVSWFGCNTACDEAGECTGTIVFDMTTDPPTFGLQGVGEVGPDFLEVRPNARCGGAGPVVWEIDRFDVGETLIQYGVRPNGAREVVLATPLVDGRTYAVGFGRGDTASAGWLGFFTAGDPESGATAEEYCPRSSE